MPPTPPAPAPDPTQDAQALQELLASTGTAGQPQEPVTLATLVRVVLYAAVTFGAKISAEQLVALVTVVEVASALWVRRKVTPTARALNAMRRAATARQHAVEQDLHTLAGQ